jgi:penicillin-binding protein 1A
MLAGLLKAPSISRRRRTCSGRRNRAAVVIGLMEEQGYLTKAEADEARANPATLSRRPPSRRRAAISPTG